MPATTNKEKTTNDKQSTTTNQCTTYEIAPLVARLAHFVFPPKEPHYNVRYISIVNEYYIYIYIYIYITSIRTSANTKESSVDTTYKHALSLSLSVLTSFKVRVCRTVVRFYLFGFDWHIKVPSFTLQISHWIASYKFCSDEIEDY